MRDGIGDCDGIFGNESEEGEDEEQGEDEAGGAGVPGGFFTQGELQGAGGDERKNKRGEEYGGGCYLMRLRISSISFLVSC